MPSATKKTKKSPARRTAQSSPLRAGAGLSRPILLGIIVLAATIGVYVVAYSSAASGQAELRSGVGGNLANDTPGNQCLDQNGGIYDCNGSAGEKYSFDSMGRIHMGSLCMAESGASSTKGIGSDSLGRGVVGVSCGSSAPWGGAWTKEGGTFHNNHAESTKKGQYCLDVTGSAANGGVEVWSCKATNANGNQRWFPDTYTAPSSGGSGGGGGGTGSGGSSSVVSVASQFVDKEYEIPNGCNCGGVKIDGANIDTFTRNQPEAWCSDFASWVYWKAGTWLNKGSSYSPIRNVTEIKAEFGSKWVYNTATNRNSNPPKPGDFIMFNSGGHGGVVVSYQSGTLTTIEGNYANKVAKLHYYNSTGFSDGGNTADGWGHL